MLSLDDNGFDALPPDALPLPAAPTSLDDPHVVDRVFWWYVSGSTTRAPLFEISLRRNRLRGPIPPALLAQPCAQIDLGQNQLTGTLPVWIGHQPSIRRLTIDNNRWVRGWRGWCVRVGGVCARACG